MSESQEQSMPESSEQSTEDLDSLLNDQNNQDDQSGSPVLTPEDISETQTSNDEEPAENPDATKWAQPKLTGDSQDIRFVPGE